MKTMNKILLLITLVLFSLTYTKAQGPGREKIKALKVAMITEKLNLTPDEAEKFWPVYNKHDEAMDDLRHKERKYFGKRSEDVTNISEADATKLLAEFDMVNEQRYKLGSNFVKELKKILPNKKIVLLFKAEEEFKRKLLQRMRQR